MQWLACFLISWWILVASSANGQGRDPYTIILKYDLPVSIISVGSTTYGFIKMGQIKRADPDEILALNKDDIIGINRGAINPRSEEWNLASDLLFYPSFGYPFLLLFDPHIRADAPKIGLLYLEVMTIVGGIYSNISGHYTKFRPHVYHPETPLDDKAAVSAKFSLFGGHPAIVGASTFFTAKVYADYHPQSSFTYLLYGFAITSTLATAYTRYAGGFHFPTDLIFGTGVGVATGLLAPSLHEKPGIQETG